MPRKRQTACSPVILLLFQLFVMASSGAMAGSLTEKEQAVKAGFLFNFAKFVEWPKADAPIDGKFKFCVVNDKDFSRIFRSMAAGKKIGSATVEIVDLTEVEQVEGCQVLYLSDTRSMDTKNFLREMPGKPVLSVGDGQDFAASGGIIGFFTEDGRIRFEICHTRAMENGLNISSELLRLAKILKSC